MAAVRILAVCSANRCRSPMTAGLLQARLAELGADVAVSSAGFGPAGLPATPETVTVMAEVGIDLAPHLSTRVTAAHCADADLLIGMTRQHVIELVVLNPTSWPRAFPIIDLLRRAHQIGRRGDGERPEAWIQRVHGGRQRSSLLSLARADDVTDPIGEPVAAFRRTRDRLGRLVSELALLLAPNGLSEQPPGGIPPASPINRPDGR